MTARECYAFGDCVLDVPERQLWRAGRRVALAPKAHDLLVALVRRGGSLASKDDLLRDVWPETFVEEGILAVHVSALRKVLGDTRRTPRYIETVSGAGYRFIAGVKPTAASHLNGASSPARTPKVYEHTGRARLHLLSASMRELPAAEAEFRRAIELDPTFADAHAGLAVTCCAQAELRVAPAQDAYGRAKAAALRALALDDACADAQVALGTVLFFSEWDWTGAERSFRRALELDPEHVEAHLAYGRLLDALGRPDEALDIKRRALDRDPDSPLVHLQIAMSYWNQRRYADAIEWANRTLAIDARHLLAREFLAGAYWALGDFDRHMAENVRHAETYGVPAEALEPLKRVYAGGGRAAVVRYWIDRFRLTGADAPPVQMALFHGELGELDAAFASLERALESRDPALVYLAVAPQWDPLRADRRFAACLARMGLSAR
jgi:DNA-binding winged helix-turn-helix (wHTH) protein/Flp pilus assembly protein TadD